MHYFILFFIFSAIAQEGYPPDAIKISHDPVKKAFVKNNTCFPATVSVNDNDLLVGAGEEVLLGSDTWGSWKWFPGSIGSMNERSLQSPLKNKYIYDFGPGVGAHNKGHRISYDFTAPEGTPVFAMESGIVVRITQHYFIAHMNLALMDQVNRVEILHEDGSFSTYAHLKPNSVTLRLCQRVNAGTTQVGLSGHNGYSTGPHLHVDVIRPIGRGNFMTIPLKFLSK